MKKILITGAHHNAALVVAKALRGANFEVFWLGHKYTMRGDKNPSAEYREVVAAGLPFFELVAGKVNPRPELANIAKIPVGFWNAWVLMRRLKPDAVLTFGGYLSVPVGFWAVLLGIPLYIHEQTSIAGKANLLLSRYARQVFLTWASSAAYFPQGKTSVVGLPLNPYVVEARAARPHTDQPPTVMVMGGKQGAHELNSLVFRYLPDLLAHYNLIHITGSSTVTHDYQKALHLREHLDKKHQDRYQPLDYSLGKEYAALLHQADVVISRAGAHTVYELAYLGKPAILVPYPYAPHDEQGKNASILEENGQAEIIRELQKLQSSDVLSALGRRMSAKFTPLSVPTDAEIQMLRYISQELA